MTRSYKQSLEDLGVTPGSPRAIAVGTTVRELARATELPLPDDVEGLLPVNQAVLVERFEGRRLLTAFVRRVKGRRLWVWYRPRREHVDLIALTRIPPA